MDDGCSGKGNDQLQDDDDDCYIVEVEGGVGDDDYGHDEGLECNDDVCGHHDDDDLGCDEDVDDGEFEGLDSDGVDDDGGDNKGLDDDGGGHDILDDDGGDHEGLDDNGRDHASVDDQGGDNEGVDDQGVDNKGVQEGSGDGVGVQGGVGVSVQGGGGDADLSDYEPINDYDSPRFWDNTRGEFDFDFSRPRFRVGMEFFIVKKFRQALRHYCVVEGIEIKRKKNEKSRFVGVCSANDYV
uniref:Transposase MuDR plant domain-containing protein n=1 Tax=Nelumbo nucifera TaxID=4432 RepID=A0A822XX87_NELNU|nr:TPA_asm: hypothetical protein HUJ06_025244 [Nelumbo nucifera]